MFTTRSQISFHHYGYPLPPSTSPYSSFLNIHVFTLTLSFYHIFCTPKTTHHRRTPHFSGPNSASKHPIINTRSEITYSNNLFTSTSLCQSPPFNPNARIDSQHLVLQRAGLDHLQGPPVHLDETVAPFAVCHRCGRLLREARRKKTRPREIRVPIPMWTPDHCPSASP